MQHAIDSVDTNPTKQAKWLNHWFADTTLTNSSPVSNPVDEEAKNQFLKNAGLGQHMRCTVSVQDSVVYVLTRGNGYERSMRRELPDTDLVTDTTNNIFLAHYAAVALANNAEFVERVTSDFA